jgi:two-component system chemotaxis response regulator CheB
VCVVLHTSPHGPGRLARVLERGAALPVAYAEDEQPAVGGRVYVAPPDRHLVLEAGLLRLTCGPRENRQRPAVDTLFRSAAYEYGADAIGVVLSGALDDGTAGLWTIKDRGGVAVVQDPADAVFPWMPRSAIQYVDVDHVLPAAELAPLLARLVGRPTLTRADAAPASRELRLMTRIAKGDAALQLGVLELGPATPFTCPDCAGVLVRMSEGGVPTYRCHTGHAYSLDSLLAATGDRTDEVLNSALRSLEETVLLLRYTERHARERGDEAVATAAARRADEMQRRADIQRTLLQQHRSIAQEGLELDPPAA